MAQEMISFMARHVLSKIRRYFEARLTDKYFYDKNQIEILIVTERMIHYKNKLLIPKGKPPKLSLHKKRIIKFCRKNIDILEMLYHLSYIGYDENSAAVMVGSSERSDIFFAIIGIVGVFGAVATVLQFKAFGITSLYQYFAWTIFLTSIICALLLKLSSSFWLRNQISMYIGKWKIAIKNKADLIPK